MFEFFRLRFHFQAVDPVRFPAGGASNTIRGAMGYTLRQVACRCHGDQHSPDCAYTRIFAPRQVAAAGPSGLGDPPRPFVLRSRHLDGQTFGPQSPFSFDLHLFDIRNPPLPYLVEAFACFAGEGIGADRGRAKLLSVEQLNTDGGKVSVVWQGGECACLSRPECVPLTHRISTASLCIHFLTPTELKSESGIANRPEFPVLFARIRDRISSLRAFYGSGPLGVDFRSLGDRARSVEMTRCEITRVRHTRHSSRTGQVHPLGGFTGEAEYRGGVAEFIPYLRAARWTGVGRQTVWGKGEIAVAI